MSNRVFIGRLSSRASEKDVERFFRGYGKLREVVLKNGFGFAEFDNAKDADDAIYDLNGKELAGDRVQLEISRSRPRGSFGGDRGGGGDYRDNRGGGGGGFRQNEGRFGPPTKTRHRLIVQNLSTSISWQDLKDMCRKYGEVTFADAHRSVKNEGIVCFASRDDLKKCIDKLDGKDVNGRKLKLVDDSDDKKGDSRSRSRSRSRDRKRSRSRSPRSRSKSRSRSPKSKSRSRSKSRSASRDRSRSKSKSHSRSPSPKRSKKEDSRERSASPAKSDKEKSRSRSASPADD